MSRASPHRTRTSFSIIHIWISRCFPNHLFCGSYSISLSLNLSIYLLAVVDRFSGYGGPTDQAHAYIQHIYVLNKLFRIFFFSVLFSQFCEITFEFEKYEMLSCEMSFVRDRKCDILLTSVGSVLVRFVLSGFTRGTKNIVESKSIWF